MLNLGILWDIKEHFWQENQTWTLGNPVVVFGFHENIRYEWGIFQ
jgi:hypothetical protein